MCLIIQKIIKVSIPKGKATNACKREEYRKQEEFQSPKGRLQTVYKGGGIGFLFKCFNPQREGYKLGSGRGKKMKILTFQSPKGRLQTDARIFGADESNRSFNPQREGYKPFPLAIFQIPIHGFNPQREGYKPG